MNNTLLSPGCLTPVEAWIGAKLGRASYTLNELRAYQLAALQENFAYCRQHSPFYREHYATSNEPANWQAFQRLPFTNEAILRHQNSRLLCLGQSEVSRIVTLDTSGTTDAPKRLYFSAEDQELTVGYFHHGLLTMALPQDKILILLPVQRPGSVGDLFATAARRMDAVPLPHGAPQDFRAAAQLLRQVQMVLANPLHMLMLAETALQLMREGILHKDDISLRAILLSTDYVADSLRHRLSRQFGCPVLEHYGMTETGLGAAVSCSTLVGYHLREADLYVEIIDPDSGQPLPEGEYGEIVFSTLSRRAMPLLRYRSGDYGRYLTEPCPCGSILPRLDKVRRRFNSGELDISAFDELLLGLEGLANYEIQVREQQVFITAYGWGEQPNWQQTGCGEQLAQLCLGYPYQISWQRGLPAQAGSLAKRKITYLY